MSDSPKKVQVKTRKKSNSDVFDEFEGYLGKGNTDKIMRDLRGDVNTDIDEP